MDVIWSKSRRENDEVSTFSRGSLPYEPWMDRMVCAISRTSYYILMPKNQALCISNSCLNVEGNILLIVLSMSLMVPLCVWMIRRQRVGAFDVPNHPSCFKSGGFDKGHCDHCKVKKTDVTLRKEGKCRPNKGMQVLLQQNKQALSESGKVTISTMR